MPCPSNLHMHLLAAALALVAGCAASPAPRTAAPVVGAEPRATPASPSGLVATAPRGSDGNSFPSSPLAKPGSVPVADPTVDAAGFDRASYQRDPAAYLNVVAASRSRAVAQPGPGVALLELVGGGAFTCPVGRSVLLQARTEPGLPVTFVSLGLGAFPGTGLGAQSVAADGAGIARVEFAITPGTTGAVQVVAGSPVRAGTVEYLVHVP